MLGQGVGPPPQPGSGGGIGGVQAVLRPHVDPAPGHRGGTLDGPRGGKGPAHVEAAHGCRRQHVLVGVHPDVVGTELEHGPVGAHGERGGGKQPGGLPGGGDDVITGQGRGGDPQGKGERPRGIGGGLAPRGGVERQVHHLDGPEPMAPDRDPGGGRPDGLRQPDPGARRGKGRRGRSQGQDQHHGWGDQAGTPVPCLGPRSSDRATAHGAGGSCASMKAAVSE